ncbi:hypothetical protein AB1K32_15145 [Metabacillus dongyingensis]|uniref:hypothetical protein n=1 Tax=Metabacillus dongyingensis TaxID=2874282 RepID=UPI003B8AC114
MKRYIGFTLIGLIPIALIFVLVYGLLMFENLFLGLCIVFAASLLLFACYNLGQLIEDCFKDWKWEREEKKKREKLIKKWLN